MNKIDVRTILNITTISPENTGAWIKLMETIGVVNQDLLLDFRGIKLINPWTNEEFKRLMSNPFIYIKVYTSEKVATNIEIMLRMGGLKTGRTSNEDIVIKSAPTMDDKKRDRFVNKINAYIEKKDNMIHINMSKVCTQMGEEITVEALEVSLNKALNNHSEITDILINLNEMYIQENIIKRMAELENNLIRPVNLVINSKIASVEGYIDIFRHLNKTGRLTQKEKLQMFKKAVPVKTVGIITMFKETIKRDLFGRMGDGKPNYCRVCIFEGFKKEGNDIYLLFTVFKGDSFLTSVDYQFEHDGEKIEKPESINLKVKIHEIGFGDSFVGIRGHFNFPIMYDMSGIRSSYVVSEGGRISTENLTLPEYIRKVLHDFSIEHDREELEKAIYETRLLMQGH